MKRAELPKLAKGQTIRLTTYGDGDAEGALLGYVFGRNRQLTVCFNSRTGGSIDPTIMSIPVYATESIEPLTAEGDSQP